MGSQPARTRSGSSYARSLPPHDWELLVRLPARVLTTVAAVRPEPPAVTEILAGVAAIAAGRADPSALVREVVAAIYAGDDTPPVAVRPAVVHEECVAAGCVLAQRVPTGEADGYRRWVRRIAAAACGLPGAPPADDPVGAAQCRLLDGYGRALAG
jgi:hypothetical protein